MKFDKHFVTAEFGYLPYELNINNDQFSIDTLDNLQKSIDKVEGAKSRIYNGWIYSSHKAIRRSSTDEIIHLPYLQRVFCLPKTHSITTYDTNSKRIEFSIWCLSFFPVCV